MIRLRQVCIASPQITDADELAEIFGVNVAYRDPLIIEFGLENALLGFGGTFVEFIAPLKDGTTATRFLAKHPGGGGYMVIHDTDEYEKIRERIDAQGVRVAFESTPELRGAENNQADYGYDSFRHVQLDPRSVGGTLMEFNQTDGNEDYFGAYAPAGTRWQELVQGDDLPKIVAAECTSTDPDAMATTWATLMDKPVENEDGHAVINLDGGAVDRFVAGAANAFTRVFIEASDPEQVLERARAAGHEVAESEFEFCGVRFVIVPRAGTPAR
ncbi:VOC family protein [Aeromicrobium sp. Marseille-Q0843]|uniref:VOC family protein n=1 Tax=Aeromicrobium phoceense TaxID=2754045 RepID=A0A838XJK5_9ACTN|nr:VOC family protein [Aeromicrobium phoceense]MBA4607133.1 VOC family protein [Aeromicrobium phoceense]